MGKILITASITGQSLENWITWKNPQVLTLHMLCINVLGSVLVQNNLMLRLSSTFAGILQEQRIRASLSDQKEIPLNASWMLPMLETGNNNLRWMIPQQLDHELGMFCHSQNVLSMKCTIYEMCYLWNVLSMKCFIYEMYYPWKVPSMKCSIYEMSYLWNVLSMKCPIYEMYCPVFEMFYLWNVLSIKCPVYEMSFYEMSQHQKFHN